MGASRTSGGAGEQTVVGLDTTGRALNTASAEHAADVARFTVPLHAAFSLTTLPVS